MIAPNPVAANTAEEMLLACHSHIRHFTQLARTLAEAEEIPRHEIAAAAASVARYFQQALPLHEADENLSLYPRLMAARNLPALVGEAARTMREQHEAIDEMVPELLTLCISLEVHPEGLPGLAPRLSSLSQALEQIFSAHLQLEESVIFPALPQILSAGERDELALEMRLRRQPGPRSIHLVQ